MNRPAALAPSTVGQMPDIWASSIASASGQENEPSILSPLHPRMSEWQLIPHYGRADAGFRCEVYDGPLSPLHCKM